MCKELFNTFKITKISKKCCHFKVTFQTTYRSSKICFWNSVTDFYAKYILFILLWISNFHAQTYRCLLWSGCLGLTPELGSTILAYLVIIDYGNFLFVDLFMCLLQFSTVKMGNSNSKSLDKISNCRCLPNLVF